ncbi:hypothetical protein AAFC00_002739 [Neodothiora populina]|uniref:DUF7719 domain-containing protein n=1 Tax=Neodothiora populina TaxID=2781224 RepID=A0ABR3P8I0_9PEZI
MADDEQDAPRNRKERRAAAKANGQPLKPPKLPKTVADIPMAHPDYSGPKGKTLYDIAEERMAALAQKGQPFDSKYKDGQVRDENGNILIADDEVIGPVGEAVFLTITLAMVHFTLDVLVFQQYAMEIVWPAIFKRTGTIMPVLFTLIYLCRTQTAKAFEMARQVFFLGGAVAAGCYMIYAGNTYDYFAVMKQAPPLGTLWIFSVIEMKIPFALASMAIDAGYLVWNGYTVF